MKRPRCSGCGRCVGDRRCATCGIPIGDGVEGRRYDRREDGVETLVVLYDPDGEFLEAYRAAR